MVVVVWCSSELLASVVAVLPSLQATVVHDSPAKEIPDEPLVLYESGITHSSHSIDSNSIRAMSAVA